MPKGKKKKPSIGLQYPDVKLIPTGKETTGDRVNITEYRMVVPSNQPRKGKKKK